jgi:hypothetical protein
MIFHTGTPIFNEKTAEAVLKGDRMKIWTRIAAVAALLCLAGSTVFTALYALELSARVEELGREGYRQGLRYSRMLKDLEEEMRAELGRVTLPADDVLAEETVPAPSVGWKPQDGDGTEGDDREETVTDTTDIGDGGSTEAVTVPPLRAPETVNPNENAPAHGEAYPPHEDAPPETVPALYLVTEDQGAICVLDATGAVIRRVNVFVMTLPEADRVALSAGIPIFSEGELWELLQKYE